LEKRKKVEIIKKPVLCKRGREKRVKRVRCKAKRLKKQGRNGLIGRGRDRRGSGVKKKDANKRVENVTVTYYKKVCFAYQTLQQIKMANRDFIGRGRTAGLISPPGDEKRLKEP